MSNASSVPPAQLAIDLLRSLAAMPSDERTFTAGWMLVGAERSRTGDSDSAGHHEMRLLMLALHSIAGAPIPNLFAERGDA